MVGRAGQRIALLSIHPRFATKIMSGEKRVEFRKVMFASDVTHIVVYATAPIKKVLGFFEVKSVDEDTVSSIWSKYSSVGGISKSDFMKYFGGARKGVAINIGEAFLCAEPMSLSSVSKSSSPPQSFFYLDGPGFERVRKHSHSICF